MSRLNCITSGESHGKCLAAIIEGIPSGLTIDIDAINFELGRRQQGFGRGGRMTIEQDAAEILSGVIKRKTTGAPIQIVIHNSDFKINEMPELFRPRPGHADLAGAVKYNGGIRSVLERASARETAIRVAVGALAKQVLEQFKIEINSHVVQIGKVKSPSKDWLLSRILKAKKNSEMNCADSASEKKMIQEIKKAIRAGDTVGGKYQLRAVGLPIGLGSHVHYKRKLDGRIARALMSKQSVKAVEIGLGVQAGELWGSKTQDAISYSSSRGFHHKTNRAGGLEGGMTNGEELVVTVTMKPISTLKRVLPSINLKTRKPQKADFERSDVCAVPAGSVVGEAILAFELLDAVLEKTGGDSIVEAKRNYQGYLKQASSYKAK